MNFSFTDFEVLQNWLSWKIKRISQKGIQTFIFHDCKFLVYLSEIYLYVFNVRSVAIHSLFDVRSHHLWLCHLIPCPMEFGLLIFESFKNGKNLFKEITYCILLKICLCGPRNHKANRRPWRVWLLMMITMFEITLRRLTMMYEFGHALEEPYYSQ